jgi:hypothetical protein
LSVAPCAAIARPSTSASLDSRFVNFAIFGQPPLNRQKAKPYPARTGATSIARRAGLASAG